MNTTYALSIPKSLTALFISCAICLTQAGYAQDAETKIFATPPLSASAESLPLVLQDYIDKETARDNVIDIAPVELDRDFLNDVAQGTMVKLNLDGTDEVDIVINQLRESGDTAVIQGESADGGSTIHIARIGSKYSGSIVTGGILYRIKPFNDTHIITAVDTSKLVDHSKEAEELLRAPPARSASNLAAGKVASLAIRPTASMPGTFAVDSGGLIKVLVVYTEEFTADAGNVATYLALAESETNTGFSNSAINTSIDIVHSYETDWEFDNFGEALFTLMTQTSAMRIELEALRDTYHADVVVVMQGNLEELGTLCGQAAGIGVTAGNPYAVVKEECGTGYFSFAHEIGHLIGARHIITQDAGVTPQPYGHGYCSPGPEFALNWRTVMAYNCPGTGGPRINFWSNPDIMRNVWDENFNVAAMPMGTEADADNARLINERASIVANFRQDPVPPVLVSFYASPDTFLENVSTNIYWSTTGNATNCYIVGISGTFPVNGSVNYPAYSWSPGTYQYESYCTGPGGESNHLYETITVNQYIPPPTLTVYFSPSSIYQNQPTAVFWSSTNATNCYNAATGNSLGTSGSINYPANTFTPGVYTAGGYCTGPGGTSATEYGSLNISAPPPVINIWFTPGNPVSSGTYTTINWSTTGATSCTNNGNSVATSGSSSWNAYSSVTFAGSCSGAGGTTSYSVTLVVN